MRMQTLHVCMLMYAWTGRWADVCVSKCCVSVCMCMSLCVCLSARMYFRMHTGTDAGLHGCKDTSMQLGMESNVT